MVIEEMSFLVSLLTVHYKPRRAARNSPSQGSVTRMLSAVPSVQIRCTKLSFQLQLCHLNAINTLLSVKAFLEVINQSWLGTLQHFFSTVPDPLAVGYGKCHKQLAKFFRAIQLHGSFYICLGGAGCISSHRVGGNKSTMSLCGVSCACRKRLFWFQAKFSVRKLIMYFWEFFIKFKLLSHFFYKFPSQHLQLCAEQRKIPTTSQL